MPDPQRTKIEVYSKAGELIASFDNPLSTPSNPSAALSDDERRELMVNPTVKLVQNGESSFTYKMQVASEKFQLIKHPENRYHVNGRVYTALTDDAFVYGVDGESARVATVTLVEEQYTLKKKFVQAYNIMPYSKSLAASNAAVVEYDRTNKVASIATFVIAVTDANFSKALLWDVTDTIYILEPSDTWLEPPTHINPVSITKTETSITITFCNYGGAIPHGATAMFGAGIESIDDHTVIVLPKSNNKYKLTIDGVQYEDSVVVDEREVLQPRGSGGYALWSVIRNSGWRLGTCDMTHALFNTAQVDATCSTQVRDFTALYGTYKESSNSWSFDLAQNTDSAFRRALSSWSVDDTLYIADVSTVDGAPEWTNSPESIHVSYINATDSKITVKFDNLGGAITNDCVVAFSNSGEALEAKFVVSPTDSGFAYASTWESGYSLSIYDAVGWADAPVSARLISAVLNGDGNLELTMLNLGGTISAGATAHFVSGNEIGVFNDETDAKDIFENIKLIQELWGGVIVFDSMNKVIHYRDEDKEGTDFNTWNGFTIQRGKNIVALPSVYWNADIITRLYPLGADKLNIALVNGGKRYVDDFSYTNTVFEGYVEQPNIYDTLDDGGMLQLLYWAQREVSKVCRPRMTVKYENKVVDRRQIGGYEFDTFDLNSIVKAYYIDSETDQETSELLRIVNWEYDVWNPLLNTTIEVGDIHANVRDVFKLIYKKTEEMPVFDAKGRISADDISVGSGSSSGSRGGGGGGGGGTLADALEEQINSNAYFYQKFDQQSATIGLVAEYARTTDEYARTSYAALDTKVDTEVAAIQLTVQHNYDNLLGEISQTSSALQLWAEDTFASATLETRFDNLVTGMGNYTSIKQFADATYAKTEIETWVNDTRSYLTVSGSAIAMGSGGQFVQVGLGTVLLRGTYVDLDGSNVEIGNVGSIIKMWGSEVEFHTMNVVENVTINTENSWAATLPSGYSSIDAVISANLNYSGAKTGYLIQYSSQAPICDISFTRQTVGGVSVLTGVSSYSKSVLSGYTLVPTGIDAPTRAFGRTSISEITGVSKITANRTFVTKKL